MPYTQAHGKLTVFGDSYNLTEIWQTGIRLLGTTPPTTAQFEALDAAVNTFLSTSDLEFTAGFRYLGLKWAPQNVSGEYGDDGEAVEWLRPTPKLGGSSGYPQIALVTSLRTARTRGYASNGRMYWPSACPVLPEDGRISAADAGTIAIAAAAFIDQVNDAGVGAAAVMSTVGTGRTEPVTGVRIGRVMDTQRRRRNGLDEAYTSTVAVPT